MRYLSILLLGFFIFSCNNDMKNEIISSTKLTQKNNTTDDTIFKISLKKVRLHSKAKKVVEDWQEYLAVSEFIPKFYNTSTKEALFNAIEFYKLTSYLKDSTQIKRFTKPSIKTRINVLNNEALRLFDMDSIPSITNKEVIHETENIINAFNALNIKINNAVKKELLSKDLAEFNHLFEKKDTLEIKPVQQTKKQKKLKLEKRKKTLRKKRIKPLQHKKNMIIK